MVKQGVIRQGLTNPEQPASPLSVEKTAEAKTTGEELRKLADGPVRRVSQALTDKLREQQEGKR